MIEHRLFEGTPDGVRIHVAEQGSGPPVVFVHGFPEAWHSWRSQMDAVAKAGFRAVAMDLRGYGGSDKPRGVAMYKTSRIADDIAALIRSLGASGPVPVVGHDWGAPISYRLAMDHPELVSRLIIMNGPHPIHFAKLLRTSSAQRKRSWYVFFFQVPFLPDRYLRRKGVLGRIFRGVVSDDALREYEASFSQPYATTAALNFYRAGARKDRPPKNRVIDKDVLIVWGMRDFALGPECLEGLEPYLPHVRIERLPDVGHFVQQEAPDAVNAILLRELAPGSRMATA